MKLYELHEYSFYIKLYELHEYNFYMKLYQLIMFLYSIIRLIIRSEDTSFISMTPNTDILVL